MNAQRTEVPFSRVVGHEGIRRHLMGALTSGCISHAYLLEGQEGTGRRTMVRAFLQALFCTENKGMGEGCGRCVACRTVADGNHPDIHWIRAAKGENTIRVRQIREQLVQDMMIRPYQSEYKVYIIEGAEKLGVEAQNALLKTVEEPPEYGLVFMLANSAASLLPTILSRCVKLTFQPLPEELIRRELQKRGLSDKQVALGTAFAGGSLGQALALCEDEDFGRQREEIYGFLQEVPGQSAGWLLQQETRLEEYKKGYGPILELMEIWCRDVLVYQAGQREQILSADYTDGIARWADHYSSGQVTRILRELLDLRGKLDQNANFSLAMDCLLIVMMKK